MVPQQHGCSTTSSVCYTLFTFHVQEHTRIDMWMLYELVVRSPWPACVEGKARRAKSGWELLLWYELVIKIIIFKPYAPIPYAPRWMEISRHFVNQKRWINGKPHMGGICMTFSHLYGLHFTCFALAECLRKHICHEILSDLCGCIVYSPQHARAVCALTKAYTISSRPFWFWPERGRCWGNRAHELSTALTCTYFSAGPHKTADEPCEWGMNSPAQSVCALALYLEHILHLEHSTSSRPKPNQTGAGVRLYIIITTTLVASSSSLTSSSLSACSVKSARVRSSEQQHSLTHSLNRCASVFLVSSLGASNEIRPRVVRLAVSSDSTDNADVIPWRAQQQQPAHCTTAPHCHSQNRKAVGYCCLARVHVENVFVCLCFGAYERVLRVALWALCVRVRGIVRKIPRLLCPLYPLCGILV